MTYREVGPGIFETDLGLDKGGIESEPRCRLDREIDFDGFGGE